MYLDLDPGLPIFSFLSLYSIFYIGALEMKKCPQQIFLVCEWSLLNCPIFDSEWAKIQTSYSYSNTLNGPVSTFDAKY